MSRRMLVTAGSTAMMIDKVRKITNIFHGRTGHATALEAANRGWDVTLLTSRPPTPTYDSDPDILEVRYRTFDELQTQMEQLITAADPPDVIIHSAAVSDYAPDAICMFGENGDLIEVTECGPDAGKVPSGTPELFLRLVPTIKLVDQIRQPWGFTGLLVKFKLQVGMSDSDLIAKAHASCLQSDADLIVANCLEWSRKRAHIIARSGETQNVERDKLAAVLLDELEGRLWQLQYTKGG